ncbi:MAG: s-methyl-5-thioribose-1-phosphate isomerase [Rhizobiaceae bacterium]
MNVPSFQMPTLSRKSVVLAPDRVRILDRRVFPFRTEFVDCATVEDVARAVEEMVTQSSGPFFAASAGMVLAAREAAPSRADGRLGLMDAAAKRLIATRPTNNLIAKAVTAMLGEARKLAGDEAFAERMEAGMYNVWEEKQAGGRQLGENAAATVRDGDTILTHCWAEATLIETLAAVLRLGKRVEVICTETRPYLQGSRLTAHSVAEMGIPVTVITDNMGAWAMDRGRVGRFMTAADRVTMSGHVINKVGTLQLAIAAKAYGIPYVAMVQDPDRAAPGPEAVPIEERDPEESLHCLGMRTATPLARGWYPAFDVTPPHLVHRIATSKGVFAPDRLELHFGT